MSLFLRQWRHELRKLFARRRTWLGFGAAIVAELIFLLLWNLPLARSVFEKSFARGLAGTAGPFQEYYGGLTLALLTVTFTFLLLGGLYLALVCGDIMAKEVEDGTLRMMLSRPVSRLRIWLLKWLTCSCYTVGLVAFIAGTSLLLGTLITGKLGKLAVIYGQHPRHLVLASVFDTGPGLLSYAKGVMLLALVMHTVSAMAFMFSCLNVKPATATVMTLGIFFLDAVLKMVPYFQGYESWFLSYHLASWLRSFSALTPPSQITGSILLLLAVSLVCLGIGVWRFCRRDFKP